MTKRLGDLPLGALVIAIGALAPESHGQALYRTHHSPGPGERVRGLVRTPDFDGDTVEDYLIRYSGSIGLHSGSDGDTLWMVGAPDVTIVHSVAILEDWNGDGHLDIAVGGSWTENVDSEGKVDIYSGDNFQLLTQLFGGSVLFRLGRELACAGDVNGDGYSDLIAVGDPGFNFDTRIYLGPDGTLLRTHDGAGVGRASSVDGMGDLNGDSYDDYIIGWQQDFAGVGEFAGRVAVYSGIDGSVIHDLAGLEPRDYFGRAVANTGDVDGDGLNDFWVGAPEGFDGLVSPKEGYADLYSGADASLLRRFESCRYQHDGSGCFSPVGMGNTIDAGVDVNLDGVPDAIIGATWDHATTIYNSVGSASVVSGRTGQRLWQVWGGQSPAGDEGRIAVDDSVGILGDLNGDGYPEFGLAYPEAEYDISFPSTGRVRIFLGGPGDAELACVTSPNSVGTGALMELPRAISVSGNVMRLRATRVPAGQVGVFLYGHPGNGVPFGDGELCIAPPIVRMGVPRAISDKHVSWLDLDLAGGPYTGGPNPITLGSTWRFQFWYRDPAGTGASGFNLSDARDVTVTP